MPDKPEGDELAIGRHLPYSGKSRLARIINRIEPKLELTVRIASNRPNTPDHRQFVGYQIAGFQMHNAFEKRGCVEHFP